MTGYDRPKRSYYLDDMEVKAGDLVLCKCNMGMLAFTPGLLYIVQHGKQLINDLGELVKPSARFMYERNSNV